MPHSFAVETSRANVFHAAFMQKPVLRVCQGEAWVSIHESVVLPWGDGDGFCQPRSHVHMHLYVHRDWLILYKTVHHMMTADAYIHDIVTNG